MWLDPITQATHAAPNAAPSFSRALAISMAGSAGTSAFMAKLFSKISCLAHSDLGCFSPLAG